MAKSDWIISGTGGLAIIDDGGSKRCQLIAQKLMLWGGRSNLQDSEVVIDVRLQSNNGYAIGGIVLRSDLSGQSCYFAQCSGSRVWEIYKKVAGVNTRLGLASSGQPYSSYVKTRFRADGYQLTIEEYVNGAWQLLCLVQDTGQSFLTGYAGLTGASAAGYYILFDNVEIGEVI